MKVFNLICNPRRTILLVRPAGDWCFYLEVSGRILKSVFLLKRKPIKFPYTLKCLLDTEAALFKQIISTYSDVFFLLIYSL